MAPVVLKVWLWWRLEGFTKERVFVFGDKGTLEITRPKGIIIGSCEGTNKGLRGEDTRENFTSHLYAALYSKKIKTFIDSYDLERGDEISQALLNAIEESKIAVIIFSKGYATSRWCLEELAKIIEGKKAEDLILPVFYHADPSDIRNQKGSFEKAFVRHKEKQSSETVMRWRNALTKAANLSGFDSSDIR
ncbi:TMV resistance protein N-like [Pistacia vera]|uniref:TMV resistance protein N-like n=1 Tax=Pistacia vera TaxID=55513 RepID=UPI001262C3B6|nr:TMV resistance protein N-like [Pistacia vera]